MFVYREEYYLSKREPEQGVRDTMEDYNAKHEVWLQRMQSTENKAEIIVGKQRHGPTGSVNLHFEKQFTHFSDLKESTHMPDAF